MCSRKTKSWILFKSKYTKANTKRDATTCSVWQVNHLKTLGIIQRQHSRCLLCESRFQHSGCHNHASPISL
ncbi:hypothetical protein A0H81_13217 [Grifola frondosa]|uniref:Uncharacterized protein n=1 Tax=Grifola frondosa TaxID=5627 RepID=A0A1C7LQC5_GRIFR|nr:hypothetical protein A0H81_13217 [Grifola frondosa]